MSHPIIEAKRAQVVEVCRRHGVARLEVFGSAARDDFDETRSDIDFLVELPADGTTGTLRAYFDLKDALEAIFGRPVDLVSAGSVRNPYVKASIDRDRQVVYSARSATEPPTRGTCSKRAWRCAALSATRTPSTTTVI